jgi:outer membrane protein assembly factor BamB
MPTPHATGQGLPPSGRIEDPEIGGYMLKHLTFFVLLTTLLSSCIWPWNKNDPKKEPPYTPTIAWVSSNTNSVRITAQTIVDGAIYTYQDSFGFQLVKLYAETGTVLWRSSSSYSSVVNCAPAVIGDYVYILVRPSYIYSFDIHTGSLSAIIETNLENSGSFYFGAYLGCGDYLYFCTSTLCRLDVRLIDRTIPRPVFPPDEWWTEMDLVPPQRIEYETIWQPETGYKVRRDLFMHENVIYIHTYAFFESDITEIAGFSTITSERVFYQKVDYDEGTAISSFAAYDGVLCVMLGRSITGYDLQTGEELYRKVFEIHTGTNEFWSSGGYTVGLSQYNGRIYFSDSAAHGPTSVHDNIQCVDIKTGERIWSAAPPISESLGAIPIVAYGKVYLVHGYGLRVYDAETGELLGVDPNFEGNGFGYNVLYGDYMITTRYESETGRWPYVAVYVGK